jgi:hypothetical protein
MRKKKTTANKENNQNNQASCNGKKAKQAPTVKNTNAKSAKTIAINMRKKKQQVMQLDHVMHSLQSMAVVIVKGDIRTTHSPEHEDISSDLRRRLGSFIFRNNVS